MQIRETHKVEVVFTISDLKEILSSKMGFNVENVQIEDITEYDNYGDDHIFKGIQLIMTKDE